VLDLPISTLYVGHGGPLAMDAVRRRLAAGMLPAVDVPPAEVS